MKPKTFRLAVTRVDADGTEQLIAEKILQKPEFWDDQSEQAARDHALSQRIGGQL